MKLLRPTHRCEPVFIHWRRDGTQVWCGLGVCVLSGAHVPGRNEIVWINLNLYRHAAPEKCELLELRSHRVGHD